MKELPIPGDWAVSLERTIDGEWFFSMSSSDFISPHELIGGPYATAKRAYEEGLRRAWRYQAWSDRQSD